MPSGSQPQGHEKEVQMELNENCMKPPFVPSQHIDKNEGSGQAPKTKCQLHPFIDKMNATITDGEKDPICQHLCVTFIDT